jgi:hypothetical protein
MQTSRPRRTYVQAFMSDPVQIVPKQPVPKRIVWKQIIRLGAMYFAMLLTVTILVALFYEFATHLF